MGDIDEDPYSGPIALLLSSVPTPDADDCAPGLETPGNASLCWVLTRPEVRAALRLHALADHDRPSPGDDITREALDVVDGQS